MRARFPLIVTLAVALLVSLVVSAPSRVAAAEDIFFSEYLEGTQANGIFNIAVELYNPTAATVDATQEEILIEVYLDGSAVPSQGMSWGAFSGLVIPPGETYVIAQITADPALLALADDTVLALWPLDGNDALVLRRGGAIVDVIGQLGFDPGPGGWGSGDITTVDHTLRRKSFVCADTDGSDPFDPTLEWDSYPIDTFDGFGFHEATCGATTTDQRTWGRVKNLFR